MTPLKQNAIDNGPSDRAAKDISKKFSISMVCASLLIWIWLFKDFVSGSIPVNVDSYSNYAILKYFFNNLLNGVIPLWDPFLYGGRHFLYGGFSTALSPFALFMPALHLAGLDYYHGYLAYICFYFFIGTIGFYLLASKIFNSRFFGLIAFELLLFSGMGGMLFNQVLIVYMFVPCTWFFLFFMNFLESFKIKYFWGIVFTLMLMIISYLPFYFLVLFLIISISLLLIYSEKAGERLRALAKFLKTHAVAVVTAIALLSVSALPLFIFKMTDKQGEYVSPGRHNCAEEKDVVACMTEARMNFVEVGFSGTLGERSKGGRLFSNLDKFSFNSDEIPYIPITAYLFIIIAALTVLDRKRFILVFAGFWVFMISYGGATRLAHWLFDHVFFFQYFRNYFFFISFLIPIMILFAVGQFKAFLDQPAHSPKDRLNLTLYLIFVHASFLSLLIAHDDILWCTYLSVALSCIISIILVSGSLKTSERNKLIIFTLLIIIEPASVLYSYSTNASLVHTRIDGEHRSPKFEYTRPEENLLNKDLQWRINGGYPLLIHMMLMRDTNGKVVPNTDSILKETYFLNIYRDWASLSRYLRHKIFIYNKVEYAPITAESRKILGKTITTDRVAALVTALDPRFQQLNNTAATPPTIVERDSPLFKVTKFTVNQVIFETSFDEPKFLVYNDSYSQNWKVLLNGKNDILYKANLAFKGVFLPAGHNIVTMTYTPIGGTAVYIVVMSGLLFLLIFLIYLFSKREAPSELAQEIPGETVPEDVPIYKKSYLIYILISFLIYIGINTRVTETLRSKYLGYNVYLLGEDSPIDAILYYDFLKHTDPAREKIYQNEIERNYLLLGQKLAKQKNVQPK